MRVGTAKGTNNRTIGDSTGGRSRPGMTDRRRPIAIGTAAVAILSLVAAAPAAAADRPTAAGGDERPHALSADGSVVLSNGQLDSVQSLLRHGGNTAAVSLGVPAVELAASADASVVAVIEATPALRIYEGDESSVVDVPVAQPITDLVISGDGRYLAFSALAEDGVGAILYRFDRSTGQLDVLPAETGVVTRPIDMSNDGAQLLVWRGSDPDVGQLGVLDIAALTLTKVTVDPVSILDAALAPDGSSVLFASASAIVGGVEPGIHLYQTTLDDLLIQLAPISVELNDSVEIAASGHLVVQRSSSNQTAVQVIDRRSGEQWTRAVPGVSGEHRITPIEVSDDLSTVLVDVEVCAGSACTPQGLPVSVQTGVSDPLALRWIESDRPLFDSLDRLYLAIIGRPADSAGRAFWINRLVAGDSLESVAVGLLASTEASSRFADDMIAETVAGRALSSVLGRPATAAEIAAAVAANDQPGTVALIVSISESAEAVSATGTVPPQSSEAGQLIRLYRAVFGRFPDGGGYRYWAEQQSDGLSLNAMIDAFAESDEYHQRFGDAGDVEVTIAQLYRNVLDREPDAEGSAYWTEQLANGTGRNVMLKAFVDSPENIRRTGTRP